MGALGAGKLAMTTPTIAWLRGHWVRAFVTAGALGVFLGNQGFRSLVTNWIELRSLSREIAALETENAKTNARLKELRESESALEREARRIGFIKDKETEYRFDPPQKRE